MKGSFLSNWVHSEVGGDTIVMYVHTTNHGSIIKNNNIFRYFTSYLYGKIFITCFLRSALTSIFSVINSKKNEKNNFVMLARNLSQSNSGIYLLCGHFGAYEGDGMFREKPASFNSHFEQ